ncbi:MAG: site-specific integrase [Candidatus Amulumruptor caecigallinarius]|nr:site-specific integrase [Candidatus Amulumruptor caecigallinarius]
MRFSELFEEWFESLKVEGVKDSTREQYRHRWHSMEGSLGTRFIRGFGQAAAREQLMRMLNRGYGVDSCRKRMQMLRQMLRFAAQELGEDTEPTSWRLKYPLHHTRDVQCMSARDAVTLVTAVASQFQRGDFSQVAPLVALLAGLRIGEVCGLRWEDIDRKRHMLLVRRTVTEINRGGHTEVRVTPPKTEAGWRSVPMLPQLERALKKVGGASPRRERYIVGGGEEPVRIELVRQAWVRLVNRIPIKDKVNFHGLRHTFGTMMVECGNEVKTVSTIMGHADVTTTMRLYVHPSAEKKSEAIKKAFRKIAKIKF